MITGLVLYPVYPEPTKVKGESAALRETFSGFLSAGPRYKVVRQSLFIERYYGQVQLHSEENESGITLSLQGDSILLYTKSIESQMSFSSTERDYRLNDSTFVFFAD